jgi:hypothetical protein
MGAAGHNTGNLLFTNAVWGQIAGEKLSVGFKFDPEKANRTLRALVIPAANWFSPRVDFSDLADIVEKLDIPVVMIGLGAQDADYSGKLDIPDGTVRLIRAAAERSQSVSVRGHYTAAQLAHYGIKNVTVTGCPSLYHDFRPGAAQDLAAAAKRHDGPLLLHSTRYFASHKPFARDPSIHRDIFRLAYETNTDLLLQSEPEEISMITEAASKPEIEPATRDLMLQIYGADNWANLEAFILKRTHVFFDPAPWTAMLQDYGQVFGTRLHATIMALNSGIPAVLIHHDSRTREICEFAAIPHFPAKNFALSSANIRKLSKAANYKAYLNARYDNAKLYFEFLSANGLEPSATPVH